MLYFDTSFLAPLVLPEATSEAIAGFVAGLPAGELAVSDWTCVEFASLLGREVRMGGLTAEEASRAADRFQAMVDASFAVLIPSAAEFTLARTYLGDHGSGLRAGDALHLGIAKGRKARIVYSLDKTLLRAGRRLGIPTGAGIRLSGDED